MKVSEAKTKVCPFMQNMASVITSGEAEPRDYGIAFKENAPANINCICGDCMAWTYYLGEEDEPEDEKEGYCKRIGQ